MGVKLSENLGQMDGSLATWLSSIRLFD